MRRLLMILFALSALSTAACGGKKDPPPDNANAPAPSAAPADPGGGW